MLGGSVSLAGRKEVGGELLFGFPIEADGHDACGREAVCPDFESKF